MSRIHLLLLTLSLLVYGASYASDDHGAGEKNHKEEGHAKNDGHNHEESEEEEGGGSVGPEKGITEFSERNGFKLSPEALKNFDLKYLKLNGDGPWPIPKAALVHSGEETNLFRKRSGFFKRIDFETSKNTGNQLTVDSDDLRDGDEIVIVGLGFLRIAELAATGGVAHGHSH